MRAYFVLSGENEALAREELRGLISLYDPHPGTVYCLPRLCVAEVSGVGVLTRVAERAALVREAGLVLRELDLRATDIAEGLAEVREKARECAWLHVTVISGLLRESAERLRSAMAQALGLPLTFSRGRALRALVSGGSVVLGFSIPTSRQKLGYKKVFDRSIAITPKLARVLINLSLVKEGEVLLDPFVGTGTIILEARRLGVLGIGVDLDWSLVRGFAKNMLANAVPSIPVLGDSAALAYQGVDAIVTDPPYGRGASTRGRGLPDLYEEFLGRALESVKRGRRIVFMSPVDMEEAVEDSIERAGGVLKGKHYMFVHSGLGRAIYVVVSK